jgi:hypothetical protein
MTTLVILSLAAAGQCPGGQCVTPSFGPAPGPTIVIEPPVVFEPAPIERRYVTYQGVQFEVEGVLQPNGRIRWNPERPFNARSMAAAKARAETARKADPPPRPTPPRPEPDRAPTPAVVQNFGVDPARVGARDNHYTAPGAESRRFVAEASDAESRAGKLHVTVIGTDAERAPVVRDLKTHPAFAGLRDDLLVQDYRPDEWAVDPALGFRPGKPAIVVQTARGPGDPKGGRVVYRSGDYAMGPEGLAEAIRRTDPDYRPDADPGPAADPAACPFGFTRDHWPAVLAVAAILVVVARNRPGRRA